jgi:hypothetical protein
MRRREKFRREFEYILLDAIILFAETARSTQDKPMFSPLMHSHQDEMLRLIREGDVTGFLKYISSNHPDVN